MSDCIALGWQSSRCAQRLGPGLGSQPRRQQARGELGRLCTSPGTHCSFPQQVPAGALPALFLECLWVGVSAHETREAWPSPCCGPPSLWCLGRSAVAKPALCSLSFCSPVCSLAVHRAIVPQIQVSASILLKGGSSRFLCCPLDWRWALFDQETSGAWPGQQQGILAGAGPPPPLVSVS